MGLPELTFALKKAAENVVTRVSAGVVGMILRDAKANGVYTIHRESDIPTDLGVANVEAIKRAMIGYINKPYAICVCVISTEADISTGFTALSSYSYDYLAGPVDITEEDASELAELIKTQRVKRYVGKAVLPDTAADYEGVINFSAANIKSGGATYTAAQYSSRIAGILAGTPADCSATYAVLSEVTSVDASGDPDADVDAGIFSSALSSTASGAAIGSMILPGLGTAIGAAAGGVLGAASGGLSVLENKDSAFKSYIQDAYRAFSGLMRTSTPGRTTAIMRS